jgi:hypothetical protein
MRINGILPPSLAVFSGIGLEAYLAIGMSEGEKMLAKFAVLINNEGKASGRINPFDRAKVFKPNIL